MLLYVVFDTGFEYHMHFTQKPIFVGARQEMSAHFWTFLPWLTYFHDLNIFFIFFLTVVVIFWKSMKNYIDLRISLLGLRFRYPNIWSWGAQNLVFLSIWL